MGSRSKGNLEKKYITSRESIRENTLIISGDKKLQGHIERKKQQRGGGN